jgi:ATP adenylyltransferase
VTDRLWTPWRLAYVTSNAAGNSPSASEAGCIFCAATAALEANQATTVTDPKFAAPDDLVVANGRTCYVILNLYPYNNGHLMIVPKRHVASLASANETELAELMQLTRLTEIALTEAYRPHGINLGINLGRAAGAGVVDHVHIHALPRWYGDSSFIGVIGDTRVIPEDLQQTAGRLRPIFERLLATT